MNAAHVAQAAKVVEAAKAAELRKQREMAEAERENSLQEEVDAEVFSTYECRSLPLGLGKAHPGDTSEPGLLAAVPLPPPTYGSQAFEGEAIENTKLSRLQLEGVLYAAQRHTHLLPDGKRAGFFIGDGAGVGKGRQIAGIVLDSWARGRNKHVWFSISNDLKLDAQRDLRDVGCHISIIDGCQGLDAASSKGLGMSQDAKHGCLFSTYSTLAGASRGGKKSRLEQLADWCGGSDSFEGCLVFDEAHKAKNFNSVKEENSTKIAQAVIKIQARAVFLGKSVDLTSNPCRAVCRVSTVLPSKEMLPKARVVYCSATGVTDIGNLAYATRLGLWGAQAPFSSFKEFKESMERRGLGALEMLAMELKAKGSYVSRGLGWTGAEFETYEARLPLSSAEMYDKAVKFWMDFRAALEKAASMCGNSGMCKADKCQSGHVCSPMRQFWGQQQRFFKDMANSSKVPFVVEQAKQALSAGMSVVVGLQSTGESGMDKAMAALKKRPGDSVDRLVSAARHGTISFIRQFFPTRTVPKEVHVMSDGEIDQTVQFQLEVHIKAGNTSPFDVTQARSNLLAARERTRIFAAQQAMSIVLPECEEAKARLLAEAEELELLPSPLDALIDALGGPGEVAEMTGRRGRLVRKDGTLKYDLRAEDQETSLNIREREMFMSGKKKVAIISDAASTGVSLHAAAGSGADSRRRLHITLELPWSADKAIQQLGRSHRSNQLTAPVFRLLVTDLGGERRFAAAVAKRLASLGALTKGDRRAATGADFTSFDLDTKYGRKALRMMFQAISGGNGLAPGVSLVKLRWFVQEGQNGENIDSEQAAAGPSTTPSDALEKEGTEVAVPTVAATTADAEAELGPDGMAALRTAVNEATEQSVDDMAIEPAQYNNVTLFLGRLQCLPVKRQNLMFAYLAETLEAVVAEARASGVYDEGIADLRASSVTLKTTPEDVAKDPATGAVTTLAQVVLDRGVSWEQALAKRAEAAEAGMDQRNKPDGTRAPGPKGTGFYRSHHKDITTQRKLVLLAVRKARHHRLMVITRPNTGTSGHELDLMELREKYDRIPDEEAAMVHVHQAWDQTYETSDGADFRGSRKVTLGLLSGSLLPLWSALEKTVAHSRAVMTQAEQALKVYRVILDDGKKLVGVRFPTAALPSLRQHLKEALTVRKAIISAGGGGTIEDITPIDPKTLRKAKTPPNTMLSFFGRAPSSSSTGSVWDDVSAAGTSTVSFGEKRKVGLTTLGSGRSTSGYGRKRGRGSRIGKGKSGNSGSVAKGVAALFGARATGVGVSEVASPPEAEGGHESDASDAPVAVTPSSPERDLPDEVEIIELDSD